MNGFKIYKSVFLKFLCFIICFKTTKCFQLETSSSHGLYTPLLEKNDIPNGIAKIFTLTDRNSGNVCFLRNTYLEQQDVPKECTCTFSRLQKLELECANEKVLNSKNCNQKLCETCCVLSLSSKFNQDFSKGGPPVNCKIRCFNSPTVTDITQDSLQTLNDYLLKIDALYNTHNKRVIIEEKKEVPTQYQILPLNKKEDTL